MALSFLTQCKINLMSDDQNVLFEGLFWLDNIYTIMLYNQLTSINKLASSDNTLRSKRVLAIPYLVNIKEGLKSENLLLSKNSNNRKNHFRFGPICQFPLIRIYLKFIVKNRAAECQHDIVLLINTLQPSL